MSMLFIIQIEQINKQSWRATRGASTSRNHKTAKKRLMYVYKHMHIVALCVIPHRSRQHHQFSIVLSCRIEKILQACFCCRVNYREGITTSNKRICSPMMFRRTASFMTGNTFWRRFWKMAWIFNHYWNRTEANNKSIHAEKMKEVTPMYGWFHAMVSCMESSAS